MAQSLINIIITGVGGQGNILASQLVASAAIADGWHASIGETYGASQRGGSVMSHVRIARDFQVGPLIPAGEADVIVGFEPMETLRVMLDYANPKTKVIVNPRPTYPLGVGSGAIKYPDVKDLIDAIKDNVAETLVVPATDIAQDCGVAIAQNVVMVGALAGSSFLPIGIDKFEDVVADLFSGAKLDLNLTALRRGAASVPKSRGDRL